MASTILPNGRLTFLPSSPTDKQVFVDSDGIKWTFILASNLWEKAGTNSTIPITNSTTTGFLSAQDKTLLDRIPAVPGGFGIIVDPKRILKTPANPEGVISGDIVLRSESLDITCVGSDRVKLNCSLPPQLECQTSNHDAPGLSFKLSDKFIDTLFVHLITSKGKTGLDGERGEAGDPGFSEGPKGLPGRKGLDVTAVCQLTGISFNDLPGLTDTSIVDVQVPPDDGHGGKLVATMSKLNIQNAVASKIIATPLSRTIQFVEAEDEECPIDRLANWTIFQPPGDESPLNVQLVRLPKGSAGDPSVPVNFNATISLNDFVTDIVTEYQARLTKLDKIWGKQVRTYIEGIDDQARAILSELANQLAMCEFNLPAFEYCLTIVPCSTSPTVP